MYFTVLGLTGSSLMFKVELHKLMKPRLLQVAVPSDKRHASLDQIAQNFKLAYKAKIASITLPMAEDEPLVIGYMAAPKAPGQKEEWSQCYVNPYTGALLGDEIAGGRLFNFLRNLHVVLLLDKLGTNLQRVGVLFLVVLLLSGLWLWMPSPKHFWQQFKQRTTIRPNASFGRLNFDIHNAVGFYSSTLLLMFALTAVSHLWKEQSLAVVSALTATSLENGKFPKSGPATEFSYDKVLQTVRNAVPGYQPAIITDSEHVLMAQPDSHMVFPTMVNIAINKETGVIENIEKPESLPINAFIMRWLMPIHFGHWGRGVFYFAIKSLWFVAGLCPLVLSVTGILMYLQKQKAARKKEQSQKEMDAQKAAHTMLQS